MILRPVLLVFYVFMLCQIEWTLLSPLNGIGSNHAALNDGSVRSLILSVAAGVSRKPCELIFEAIASRCVALGHCAIRCTNITIQIRITFESEDNFGILIDRYREIVFAVFIRGAA